MSALKPASRLSLTARRRALAEQAAAEASRALSTPTDAAHRGGLCPITITNLDSPLRSAAFKSPAERALAAPRGSQYPDAAKSLNAAELPPPQHRAWLKPPCDAHASVSGMQRGSEPLSVIVSPSAEVAPQCMSVPPVLEAPAAWTAGLADDGQPANFDCLGDFDFVGDFGVSAPPLAPDAAATVSASAGDSVRASAGASVSASAPEVPSSRDSASAPVTRPARPLGPTIAAASASPQVRAPRGGVPPVRRHIQLPPAPQRAATAAETAAVGSAGAAITLQAARTPGYATSPSHPAEQQPRHQQGPAGERAPGMSRFAARQGSETEPSPTSGAVVRARPVQPAQRPVLPEASHWIPHHASHQTNGAADAREIRSERLNPSRSPSPWLTKASNAVKGLPGDPNSQTASRGSEGYGTPQGRAGPTASRLPGSGGGGGRLLEAGSSARRSHRKVERLFLADDEAGGTPGSQIAADEVGCPRGIT